MMRVMSSGQRVLGAATMVASLLLATALWAEDQSGGGDSSGEPVVVDDPGLILVDPPADGVCEPDCAITIDDGWVDEGTGGIDDGWVGDGSAGAGGPVDDGIVDDGILVDDGTSGEDGGMIDGTVDGGVIVDDGGLPVIYYADGGSDCGGCEMQSAAGGPAPGAVSGVGRHRAGAVPGQRPARGPDLCIDHPPALNWICDWQQPATK